MHEIKFKERTRIFLYLILNNAENIVQYIMSNNNEQAAFDLLCVSIQIIYLTFITYDTCDLSFL